MVGNDLADRPLSSMKQLSTLNRGPCEAIRDTHSTIAAVIVVALFALQARAVENRVAFPENW